MFNRLVVRLTRLGVSVRGSRELRVRGRKTGEWRKIPVNLLHHDGAPLPRRAAWAHAVGAQPRRPPAPASCASAGGSRRSAPCEVADADKVDILRDYLRHWKMEVGVFFDGVGPDATDDELAAIAPGYPVFLVESDPAIAA